VVPFDPGFFSRVFSSIFFLIPQIKSSMLSVSFVPPSPSGDVSFFGRQPPLPLPFPHLLSLTCRLRGISPPPHLFLSFLSPPPFFCAFVLPFFFSKILPLSFSRFLYFSLHGFTLGFLCNHGFSENLLFSGFFKEFPRFKVPFFPFFFFFFPLSSLFSLSLSTPHDFLCFFYSSLCSFSFFGLHTLVFSTLFFFFFFKSCALLTFFFDPLSGKNR